MKSIGWRRVRCGVIGMKTYHIRFESHATIFLFHFNEPCEFRFFFVSSHKTHQTRPDTYAHQPLHYHISFELRFEIQAWTHSKFESKSVNSVDELQRKIRNLLPWQNIVKENNDTVTCRRRSPNPLGKND